MLEGNKLIVKTGAGKIHLRIFQILFLEIKLHNSLNVPKMLKNIYHLSKLNCAASSGLGGKIEARIKFLLPSGTTSGVS